MKISVGIALGALLLSACVAQEPRSRGVGFDDYSNYELERAQREAALASGRTSIIPPAQINTIPGPAVTVPAVSSTELANAGIGQAQQATPAGRAEQ